MRSNKSTREKLYSNESTFEKLYNAIFDNDPELTITTLLKQGININETDAFGNNILYFAVMFNVPQGNLLDIGIDIEHANNYGVTPLKIAVNRINAHWTRALLKKGAIVNIDMMELMSNKEWIKFARGEDYDVPETLIITKIVDQFIRGEEPNLEPLNRLNEIKTEGYDNASKIKILETKVANQANKMLVMQTIIDQFARGEEPNLEPLNRLNEENEQSEPLEVQVKNLLNKYENYTQTLVTRLNSVLHEKGSPPITNIQKDEKCKESIFVTRLDSILHKQGLPSHYDIKKYSGILPIEFVSKLDKKIEDYKTEHHITDNSSYDAVQAVGDIIQEQPL